ncbi:hypothetical protein B5P46_16620 [Rhizobium leguminosarum]|uniref:Uncharacterized protein n=1 Tax=Rhizobium leguminosarum TaxID=384 RepID=A0A4Q1TZ12_RHILE|nr:hypothetical protein B5P46_16620 [Rhizobium leguminosarum]
MRLNQAPSSDPSGHLLPAGEKRGASLLRILPTADAFRGQDVATYLFSPAGRRCRQADEGVFAAYSEGREAIP